MRDFTKLILLWIGIPIIGVSISCILGWLATKIHKNLWKIDKENKQ
jgi:hypothetical protein